MNQEASIQGRQMVKGFSYLCSSGVLLCNAVLCYPQLWYGGAEVLDWYTVFMCWKIVLVGRIQSGGGIYLQQQTFCDYFAAKYLQSCLKFTAWSADHIMMQVLEGIRKSCFLSGSGISDAWPPRNENVKLNSFQKYKGASYDFRQLRSLDVKWTQNIKRCQQGKEMMDKYKVLASQCSVGTFYQW